MVQKQAMPVQEQIGNAQALTLTREAASKLMASRIERSGTELTGVTVVLSLGEGKYLKAKLPGETVDALRQKLLAVPPAGRPGFMTAWMGRVQDAMYDAYTRATTADPATTLFSYTIPQFEAQAQPAAQQTPFRATVPVIQAAPQDTTTKAPVKVELPPLPKGVKGKGTTKTPYLIDLTGKAPKEGPNVSMVIPIPYEIVGLDENVQFKYTLMASQLKEMFKNRASDVVVELRSLTSQAIERYGAERGFSGASQDFVFSIEGAMRELPHGFKLAADKNVKDPELRKYLGLQ
ncbi:MAG: hypothetical protein PHV13_01425 [Candidatus ainarchaeum sp.]|nr:hypothetical protein [Candidatus ainarchaeum sp.]